MIADFAKAVAQLGDPRFRRVLWLGIGLSVALLIGVYLGFVGLVQWLLPDVITLPLIGEVGWIDTLVSGVSLVMMLMLSVFLMVPVASLFTGLFLDQVADAVEARHYPHLPAAAPMPLGQSIMDALGFLAVLIAANTAALVIYLLTPIAAAPIFWIMNGYLLGHEYFQLVALRRLGRDGARAARRRHAGRIWLAGVLMAVPLTIPVVNLLVPVLGVASFTHLFHRLEGG